MKAKEMYELKSGGTINHKRYGESLVDRVIEDMGVVIRPTTEEGKRLLAGDSGGPYGAPLLEDSPGQLTEIS